MIVLFTSKSHPGGDLPRLTGYDVVGTYTEHGKWLHNQLATTARMTEAAAVLVLQQC